MKFEKLVLKDDPLFGDAELKFEPGITVVYGLNKLSKASRNGNFAGKSYLLSQIPEIIWENPVLGTREDRNQLGTRDLYMRVGKSAYRLSRSKKLQVFKDDQLLFKNVKDTKQWVSSLPISENDFLGLYYLDSRRQHPLVMGTSSERSAYLTKFFNLDRIDVERKLINAKLADLKTVKAQAQELQLSIDALKVSKPPSVKIDVEELETRLGKFQKKQAKFLRYQRARDFALAVRQQLRTLKDSVDFTDKQLTRKNFKILRQQAVEALVEDKATLKMARAYETYKQQLEAYEQATSNLTDKQRQALSSRLKYRKAYEKYKVLDPIDPGKKPKKPEVVEQPKHDLAELEIKVRELQHELQHTKKFKKGKCPTCGSRVRARSVELINKELKRAKKILGQAQALQDEYEEYVAASASYRRDYAEWKAASAKFEEDKTKKKKLRAKALIYKAIKDVPECPAPFTGKKLQLEVVERMVQVAQSKIEAIDQLLPNLKLLRALLADAPKDHTKKVEVLHQQLATVKANQQAYSAYKRQYKTLVHRFDKLQRQLADEPALQLLAKAYNEKGMKRMAIEAVTKMLAQQLNKYSSLVFPDNYRFSITWEKSKLSILCHRPTGKVKTTDVRKLSGAESRLFTYLLVFAQLQFVPKQQRSNLMVLDEPTTNMHQETAESFKSALKLLHTVIPCVIVITPQSSEFYDDARALTVVRSKGKSRIVEGHPQTL